MCGCFWCSGKSILNLIKLHFVFFSKCWVFPLNKSKQYYLYFQTCPWVGSINTSLMVWTKTNPHQFIELQCIALHLNILHNLTSTLQYIEVKVSAVQWTEVVWTIYHGKFSLDILIFFEQEYKITYVTWKRDLISLTDSVWQQGVTPSITLRLAHSKVPYEKCYKVLKNRASLPTQDPTGSPTRRFDHQKVCPPRGLLSERLTPQGTHSPWGSFRTGWNPTSPPQGLPKIVK